MNAQVFDFSAYKGEDLTGFFSQNPDVRFDVRFPNGGEPINMSGRYCLFNHVYWWPVLAYGGRIDHSLHTIKEGDPPDDDARKRIHTNIVQEFMPKLTPMEFDGLIKLLDFGVEYLYNTIDRCCAEYHRSISIVEIADTLEIPEIAAAIKIDISKALPLGIKAVEAEYEKGFKKVLEVVSKPHPKNCFYPFLSRGAFNTQQFPQVLASGGTRTDVDDTMIHKPIVASYLDGFGDITEYAMDALAAKKSHFYNDREMSQTQYSNRKQQLLASTIQHIYEGDCGSVVLVPFKIHARFAKMVLGKNIVLSSGEMVTLTAQNIHEYVNTTVNLRSVMTCRYQDGYCRTCGGHLTRHFAVGTLPGILSAIEVMSPVAQQVLSNKHVAKTRASEYRIPEDLRSFFLCANNEVYFREEIDLKHLILGIPAQDVERLSDLAFVDGTSLNDQYFSKLSTMFIAKAGTYEPLTMEVSMMDRNKAVPYFSSDLLNMVKKHPMSVTQTGAGKDLEIVYISLEHFDITKPIMRAVVVNDSTRQFVRRVENLFSHLIASFTDCGDALREVTNIIWERASPNILHLETMLRASMITSHVDWGLPQLTSTECRFAPLTHIIPRREIETQLAFERWSNWIADPSSYILPKRSGAFTPFLRLTPN